MPGAVPEHIAKLRNIGISAHIDSGTFVVHFYVFGVGLDDIDRPAGVASTGGSSHRWLTPYHHHYHTDKMQGRRR